MSRRQLDKAMDDCHNWADDKCRYGIHCPRKHDTSIPGSGSIGDYLNRQDFMKKNPIPKPVVHTSSVHDHGVAVNTTPIGLGLSSFRKITVVLRTTDLPWWIPLLVMHLVIGQSIRIPGPSQDLCDVTPYPPKGFPVHSTNSMVPSDIGPAFCDLYDETQFITDKQFDVPCFSPPLDHLTPIGIFATTASGSSVNLGSVTLTYP